MAVTTTRRRTTGSITKYWGMVKDLDDSMKLELITLLAESIKPAKEPSMEEMLEGYPYGRRYTKEELNAMLDEAEAEIAAGLGIDDDDLWKEDEEEYERELAEEQKLQLEAV